MKALLLIGFFCIISALVSLPTDSSAQAEARCECPVGQYCIADGTLSSAIGSSFPVSTVYILGSFTIDAAFTINADIVYCEPPASIIINNGVTLTIANNSLLTLQPECVNTGMWIGIINKGTCSVTNSSIEYAIKALRCNSSSTFSCTNATFSKNGIGIQVNGSGGSYTCSISKSTFKCTDALNNAIAIGVSPYSSVRSHIGIDLNDLSAITIGTSGSSNYNVFDNIDYGIRGTDASADIFNNLFSRCDNGSTSGVTDPTAIYMKNTSTSSSLTLNVYNNTIGNLGSSLYNYYGVQIVGKFDADIYSNTITAIQLTGIYVTKNKSTTTLIHGNDISYFSVSGIYCINNKGTLAFPTIINIYNNTHINNGITGIDVEEIVDPNYVKLTVINNPDINTLTVGIYVEGLSYCVVKSNNLTDNSYGIEYFYCTNSQIVDNSIVNGAFGINILNANAVLAKTNLISYQSYGYQCVGTGVNCDLICNQFDHCGYGVGLLDINNFGDVGTASITSDNQWFNTSFKDLWCYGSGGSNGAIFKWYTEKPTGSGCVGNPTVPLSATPSSGAFGGSTAIIVASWQVCGQSACVPPLYKLDGAEEMIAQRDALIGDVVFNRDIHATLDSNGQYLEDLYAYRVLVDQPDFLNLGTDQDDDYQHFFDNLQNSNIGKFYQLAVDVTNDVDSASLVNSNQAINPQNIREEYLQTIFEIYFKTMLSGSRIFSSEDSATLLQIAHTSTNLAGDAPSSASAMLGIKPESEIADEFHKSTLNENNLNAEVHPNPTNESFTVELLNYQGELMELDLYDLEGKILRKTVLTSSSNSIDIADFKNGIYICKIRSTSKVSWTTKIIKY